MLGVFVAVQGVTVVWHFLERLRLTKALRLLLLAVIYLHPLLRPVVMIFFIGIGVLDLVDRHAETRGRFGVKNLLLRGA